MGVLHFLDPPAAGRAERAGGAVALQVGDSLFDTFDVHKSECYVEKDASACFASSSLPLEGSTTST